MNKIFLSINIISAIIVIILVGAVESNIYALTDQEQRNLIGFAIGCKDELAGKEPDKTQYDKVDGFSTHSIAYNVGYIDGFNSCSKSFQIDDAIEPN
jgi:hypothetical protein